uniref:Uncharacterized protein n=1 Tax=Arundo donax TaxID=35708 RepID=A0A0A9CCR0_ARUDO
MSSITIHGSIKLPAKLAQLLSKNCLFKSPEFC